MDGLVCSHRGPFTYESIDGRLEQRPGNGGLVNAVSALLRNGGQVSWLACALSDLDREVARGRRPVNAGDVSARLLDIPRETHERFYDDACVTGLGFLFHGLVDQAYSPTYDTRFGRAWEAYRAVNAAFAAEVARTAVTGPVFVEDYHLMFVADALREAGRTPPGPMAYFHHVPWCAPAHFALLPRTVRTEILTRLLAFDTLGFHAHRWAEAFLACCAAFLPGARCEPDRVRWRDREVPIVVAPAQVDVAHLREVLAGAAAGRWRRRIGRLAGSRRLIVRVDRVDLWKNIIRGFQAYERAALDGHARDTVFVALLVRSRTHLPQYRAYLAACRREAARVNARLDPRGPGPIRVLVAGHSEHARALAGLSLADVVLVNSTSDGLNLVAKESAVAGDGRLVLSETTGAYEHIGRWTHGVNPFDVGETAAALADALRAERGTPGLREAVLADSPAAWVRKRLDPVSGTTD
jgi:trehalose 6-phosphate synthase